MQREACRTCGRTNVDDDGEKCRQCLSMSGDYECPGDGPHDHDEEGFFLYPTPEEVAAEEAVWDAIVADAIARGEI